MRYRITAERITTYEVEAATEDEAIDAMLNEQAEEVSGETLRLDAIGLCPECKGDLVMSEDAPPYCETCDREIEE